MAQTIESIAKALEMTPEREDTAVRYLAEAIAEDAGIETVCGQCGGEVFLPDGFALLKCVRGGHVLGLLIGVPENLE